jgi:cytochrome P450
MLDYDPFSDEILDDPFPIYKRLRDESPVHWLPQYNAWAISRFEDVWQVGQQPECFAAGSAGLDLLDQELAFSRQMQVEEGRSNVNSMNPPDHTVLRARIAPHFTPRRVGRLEPEIRKTVIECLDRTLPTGRCDVIADLAGKISVKVACMLIGLPLEDSEFLSGLVNRFFLREAGTRGMTPDALAAMGEMRDYLLVAARKRRERGPGSEDLLDALLAAEIGGRPFSDEEIASQSSVLVVGGTETLPKVFAGGILQLFRNPDQRSRLAADPSLQRDAFTEILRMEMPTQFLGRVVARDVEFGGRQLREGQKVLLLFRSANRDDREFMAPDTFDIDRCPPRILSFGHGTHVCLGQHAARLEARIMYEELLARVPDYHVNEAEVVPARSEFVAGYLSVPITFDPI